MDTCGVTKTVKIIGSKWTIQILYQLCQVNTMRFGQLQRALDGISPRTLSARLQELEKHRIVNKKIFKEIPLRVEYSLTEKGTSLKEVINKMKSWGEEN